MELTRRKLVRRVWLVALLGVLPMVMAPTAPAGAAGESTPAVTVKAMNPASSKLGSDLELMLTAHTEPSTLPNPSCRPQDMTLECWGSLVLRIPQYGDLAVGGFEVHRVAIGDISCGGHDGGEDDGCGDHETVMALVTGEPVRAQVNGVARVMWPGNTGLSVGTKVQVQFTFTDNGARQYGDQVTFEVREFVEGADKPLLYTSGTETIKQVQIHYVDDR